MMRTAPVFALFALLLTACQATPTSTTDASAEAHPADGAPPADADAAADAPLPDAAPPPPAARVRIPIAADGIYVVTGKDLQVLGFDLKRIEPSAIKLLNRGQELPIHVDDGADGSFDSADGITFFGAGIARSDPAFVYTETNVYWLAFSAGAGLRMAQHDGTPTGGATEVTASERTVHLEQDTYYWQSLPDGKGQDHWFWGKALAKGKRDYAFELSDIDTSAKSARVRVTLRGRTSTSAKPDHHTRVLLNGQQIADKSWDGAIAFTHDEAVAAALLKEGANTLTLESVADTSASIDYIQFNWFEVSYAARLVARQDRVDFSYAGSGATEFVLSGFGSGVLQAYDVSDPRKPARVTVQVVQAAGGTYTARFQRTLGQGAARYIVLTQGKRATPAAMSVYAPSGLMDPQNGADHIFITHDAFADGLLPLVKLHQAAGLRVRVAKLSDLYAEFGHGLATPLAIKDFLTYAYQHWTKPAPLYVALVGDTTVDYKDNFASGNVNHMPTYLVETGTLGQTPSDNWFACVDGNDLLPDLFIGRLSVQSKAELSAVVAKIVGYLGSGSAAWNKNVLFLADDNDSGFAALSDKHAAACQKAGYTPEKIYVKDVKPISAASAALIKQLDAGALIAQYVGHGMTTSLASGLLDNDDVPKLQNKGKLPFVISLSCLTGFFPLPLSSWTPQAKQTCLAEKLQLEPQKGAVAVFASAGLEDFVQHAPIADGFYDAFLTQKKQTVGEASTRALLHARTNGTTQDTISGYVLFGDPATRLKALP